MITQDGQTIPVEINGYDNQDVRLFDLLVYYIQTAHLYDTIWVLTSTYQNRSTPLPCNIYIFITSYNQQVPPSPNAVVHQLHLQKTPPPAPVTHYFTIVWHGLTFLCLSSPVSRLPVLWCALPQVRPVTTYGPLSGFRSHILTHSNSPCVVAMPTCILLLWFV